MTAKSRIPVEEEIPVPIPGSEEKRDVTGHAAAFGEVILLEMQAAEIALARTNADFIDRIENFDTH